MDAGSADLPGLGSSVAMSFVSLGVVCVLAWLALRFLARRGIGRGASGPLEVLARCPLEPRRSVYLIRAAGRCFLVGVGDGSMALLAEVDPSRLGDGAGMPAASSASSPGSPPSRLAEGEPESGFADVLAKTLGRKA